MLNQPLLANLVSRPAGLLLVKMNQWLHNGWFLIGPDKPGTWQLPTFARVIWMIYV